MTKIGSYLCKEYLTKIGSYLCKFLNVFIFILRGLEVQFLGAAEM